MKKADIIIEKAALIIELQEKLQAATFALRDAQLLPEDAVDELWEVVVDVNAETKAVVDGQDVNGNLSEILGDWPGMQPGTVEGDGNRARCLAPDAPALLCVRYSRLVLVPIEGGTNEPTWINDDEPVNVSWCKVAR